MAGSAMVTGQQLCDAIADLKASTRVTMETVGIRCQRRVSTAVYKQGLPRLNGDVVIQPPSEDRVSIFVTLIGAKSAVIKMFSTGKVRCLRSDFHTVDDARACAQSIIDRMANTPDSGMPAICLADSKFHANFKDLTWSTRHPTDIRKLSKALGEAGFRAESDTSFGDSVMVVVTPKSTGRSIKGQVLADGTIRLAGCRDDGDVAGRAVAASLVETGCLLGQPLAIEALRCEVWLTKRNFQLCEVGSVLEIDALRPLLESSERSPSAHPRLQALLEERGADAHTFAFVRFVNKVGTASPRLEIKFSPLVVEDWEQPRRKPEPVSISIHHRGEVQLAGNAEYKLAQALWFITHLVHSNAATLIRPTYVEPKPPALRPTTARPSAAARPTTLTAANVLSPPSVGSGGRAAGKRKPTPTTLAMHDAADEAMGGPLPTPPTAKRARGGAGGGALSPHTAPTPQPRWDDTGACGGAGGGGGEESVAGEHLLASRGVWAAAAAQGVGCPAEAVMASSPEAGAFHAQQLIWLSVLQLMSAGAYFPAAFGPGPHGVPRMCYPMGQHMGGMGRAPPGQIAGKGTSIAQQAKAAPLQSASSAPAATTTAAGVVAGVGAAAASRVAVARSPPRSPRDEEMVPEEEEAARGRETPLSPKCPQRPRAESPVTLAAPSTLGGAKLLELQGGKPALVMPEAPLAKGVVQAGGAVGAEGDRKVVVEGAA